MVRFILALPLWHVLFVLFTALTGGAVPRLEPHQVMAALVLP